VVRQAPRAAHAAAAPGDEEVQVSPHSKETAAKLIASRFEGYSTDEETTSVTNTFVKLEDNTEIPVCTVTLTNIEADDGSGPDHELAICLDFTPEALKWALHEAHGEPDNGLVESGALAPLKAKDAPEMVAELVAIMERYGNLATPQMVAKLNKSQQRPEALAKFAESAWCGCMANPESLSKLPADVKARAKDIIVELSKLKKD
jgi:hypothetical protein